MLKLSSLEQMLPLRVSRSTTQFTWDSRKEKGAEFDPFATFALVISKLCAAHKQRSRCLTHNKRIRMFLKIGKFIFYESSSRLNCWTWTSTDCINSCEFSILRCARRFSVESGLWGLHYCLNHVMNSLSAYPVQNPLVHDCYFYILQLHNAICSQTPT